MYQWPYPFPPVGQGCFKQDEADFIVEEQLPFSLSGAGEHLWLWVEKRGANTQWVARQLAQVAGVSVRHVGYAGLKDRHAITRQWFSLWLPGKPDPDFSEASIEGVRILKQVRHSRKLQVGALSHNLFQVRLRAVVLEKNWEEVFRRLRQTGVPNYFGTQRFGHGGCNTEAAWQWFKAGMPRVKHAERSRHLSVLRALAFNDVLAARVEQGSWAHALPGEVFQLSGSEKVFLDDGDSVLEQRLQEGDIHPTGPLIGEPSGVSPVGMAQALEEEVLKAYACLQPLWQAVRMKAARRPLRVIPQNLHWHLEAHDTLLLTFGLPAGSYASVLVESVVRLK